MCQIQHVLTHCRAGAGKPVQAGYDSSYQKTQSWIRVPNLGPRPHPAWDTDTFCCLGRGLQPHRLLSQLTVLTPCQQLIISVQYVVYVGFHI